MYVYLNHLSRTEFCPAIHYSTVQWFYILHPALAFIMRLFSALARKGLHTQHPWHYELHICVGCASVALRRYLFGKMPIPTPNPSSAKVVARRGIQILIRQQDGDVERSIFMCQPDITFGELFQDIKQKRSKSYHCSAVHVTGMWFFFLWHSSRKAAKAVECSNNAQPCCLSLY